MRFSVRWCARGLSCDGVPMTQTVTKFAVCHRIRVSEDVLLTIDVYANPPSYGGLTWQAAGLRCPVFVKGMEKGYFLVWERTERRAPNDVTDYWHICNTRDIQ